MFYPSPSNAALNGASDVEDLVRKIIDEVRALIEEPLDRSYNTELQQRIHNIRVRLIKKKLSALNLTTHHFDTICRNMILHIQDKGEFI